MIIFPTDFEFDVEVILRVQTKKMSNQPMKVNLQIEEMSQDVLNIDKITPSIQSQNWQEESINNENKKLLGNYTLKNAVQLEKLGREKGQKQIRLNITFKSPDGLNFGKSNSEDEVKPLEMNFIQNWVLDEDSQHVGPVGAILEPLEKVQKKQIEIVVKSGCQDVKNCQCKLEFKKMKMDPEESKVYIVGSESKFLVFDLELHNSGREPSLVNIVKIESLNRLPRPNGISSLEQNTTV
jgi:hypothetical protein